jgi:hypothetical protein
MSAHPYEDMKVPARYRPLLRRLQRGTYTKAELEWLQWHHPQLPPLVTAVVREKLTQLRAAANTDVSSLPSDV